MRDGSCIGTNKQINKYRQLAELEKMLDLDRDLKIKCLRPQIVDLENQKHNPDLIQFCRGS